jgi:hypothetical protein
MNDVGCIAALFVMMARGNRSRFSARGKVIPQMKKILVTYTGRYSYILYGMTS